MRANTTLIINPKGGSGKTTIAINLASYFAAGNVPVTIMDYDPQGSSMNWLRLRSPLAGRIHGANAAPQKGGRIRSVEMFVPADTQQLLVDAPAGASGLLLQELLSRADCIVIPVAPSAIDIHATANFVKELLLVGRIRTRNIRLAVVANRIRSYVPVYQPLERFLRSLGLPFLARISDSDTYVRAAETGIGIFEMDAAESVGERREFAPIIEWICGTRLVVGDDKVVDIARAGWLEKDVVRSVVARGPTTRSGSS